AASGLVAGKGGHPSGHCDCDGGFCIDFGSGAGYARSRMAGSDYFQLGGFISRCAGSGSGFVGILATALRSILRPSLSAQEVLKRLVTVQFKRRLVKMRLSPNSPRIIPRFIHSFWG